MTLETVMFVETDEEGNIEWSEGCVNATDECYEYCKALVFKEDADEIIKSLKDRLNHMSWELNPEQMGR